MNLRSIVLAISVLFSFAASATTTPATQYAVPSIADMKAQNLLSKPNLRIDSYYGDGMGGGGTYKYSADVCTDDGGVTIKDGAGNCFILQNWNGDLRNYGVTTGSAYDWLAHGVSATDITPVLTKAAAALTTTGISTIHTNGVSVHMGTSWSQPGGIGLTCDTNVGVPASSKWYHNLPGAIYEAHSVTWDRANRVTSVFKCYVAADLLTSKPTNAQTQRTQMDTIISNGDTGMTCGAQACADHDLMILGFDTGYEAINASGLILNDVNVDANVCLHISSTGAAPRVRGLQCLNYLNQNLTGNEQHFDITRIDNDGGLCQLTLIPAVGDAQAGNLADLAFAKYLYVTHLANGPSACENKPTGLWQLTNVNVGTGQVSLAGSAVLGVTPKGHWDAGTHIIYVSNLNNVANGEAINGLDAQGIPTGTLASSVWPLPPQTHGYIADTGGAANTYVANASVTLRPCTLGDGTNVPFTPAHTNTGASTLNITMSADTGCDNTTSGAVALVRPDGSALQAGDLVANANVLAIYNGTLSKFVLNLPKVYLSAPTTLAQSAPIDVPFTGSTCIGTPACGQKPSALFLFNARVDAGASNGGLAAGGTGLATCLMVGGPVEQDHDINDKVAGFQADQVQCFDHTIEANIQNSNETGLTNFATDSHGNDDDPNPIIVLVQGQVNNAHILGRKASKGGRSIVINTNYKNNPDRGCVTWTGASVASTNGALPVADVEQGCLKMDGGDTNSSGVNFVSNFTQHATFSNYQPNVTNVYEGAAAAAATCTVGSSLAGGDTCGQLGIIDPGGQGKSIAGTATNILSNLNCGSIISGYTLGASTTILPATPLANCEFTFIPNLQNMLVNFNGKVANLDGFGAHDISYLLVPFKKPENGYISIVYDGTIWRSASRSPVLYQNVNPLSVPQIVHGQVRFDYDGSQYLTLKNKNGPGGLIVDQQMHQVSSSGLKFDKVGTTSSTLNYFFVANQIDTITGAASDAGAIKLTLTTALTGANVGDQVRMHCFSMTNTEANGFWDGTVTTDTSHVDLIGSTFVSNGTGICRADWMMAATTGHAASTNGVETNSGTVNGFGVGAVTFVGEANVGGSHAVNDSAADREVASWFNRKLKTCKNHYTATRTTTSTSYAEPGSGSEIRCPFVTFGESDLGWSINGMMNNTTALDGEAVTAGFDGTTPETEEAASAAGATQQMPVGIAGSKSGLSEGSHYITLLGKAITGGTAQYFGTTPITSLDIAVPQ